MEMQWKFIPRENAKIFNILFIFTVLQLQLEIFSNLKVNITNHVYLQE